MNKSMLSLVISSALLLTACGGEDGTQEPTIVQDNGLTEVVFVPGQAKLSIPSDLLVATSSTADEQVGTLKVTPADPASSALNQMDGWSTTAPFQIAFAGEIDESSLVVGSSVRMFEAYIGTGGAQSPYVPEACYSVPAGALCTITRELTEDDIQVSLLENEEPYHQRLSIRPLKPLKPNTTYVYALTNAIKDVDGASVISDSTYEIAAFGTETPVSSSLQALSGYIKRLNQVMVQFTAGASAPVDGSSIVYSASFTTQNIQTALQQARGQVLSMQNPITVFNTQYDTLAVGGLGAAEIFKGYMQTPYYGYDGSDVDLSTADVDTLKTRTAQIIGSSWQHKNDDNSWSALTIYNAYSPTLRSMQTIPVLVTKPKTAKPEGGYPVVIFQHGITQNRSNLLAIADALASQGFVGIAIDIPMHGLVAKEGDPASLQLSALLSFDSIQERHLSLDFNQDGQIDDSGANFFYLGSLLNIRDNVRQGVVDLLNLSHNLNTLDFDVDGQSDINMDKVNFVGHSLGAILGTDFVALDSSIKAAVLANPGSGLIKLMVNSQSFSPVIIGGLAAAGISTDSPKFEDFQYAAQTAVDAGDPINFASGLSQSSLPILAIEVQDDSVIPNSVTDAPLSGTEPLLNLLQLSSVKQSVQSVEPLKIAAKFAVGHHGSLLKTCDLAKDAGCTEQSQAVLAEVRKEIQTAMVSFLATQGHAVQFTHTEWLQ